MFYLIYFYTLPDKLWTVNVFLKVFLTFNQPCGFKIHHGYILNESSRYVNTFFKIFSKDHFFSSSSCLNDITTPIIPSINLSNKAFTVVINKNQHIMISNNTPR